MKVDNISINIPDEVAEALVREASDRCTAEIQKRHGICGALDMNVAMRGIDRLHEASMRFAR